MTWFDRLLLVGCLLGSLVYCRQARRYRRAAAVALAATRREADRIARLTNEARALDRRMQDRHAQVMEFVGVDDEGDEWLQER